MRCNLFAAFDNTARRARPRQPDKHHRPPPAAPSAESHAVAVALDHTDTFEWNTKQICQDLCIGRRVTHAKVERARDDGDCAFGFEMDRTQFFSGSRGYFEIATNAQPAQEAAFLAFALALIKAGVISRLQRLFEDAEKVAAVINHIGGGFEWQIAFSNDIALAQVDTVYAELAGREIKCTLHVIIAFGPARAAIR